MTTVIADLPEKTEKDAPAMFNPQEELSHEFSNGFLDDTVWEAFQAQLEANRQAQIAELDCLPADGSGD